ncbi:hypothetical protein HBI56_066450 [Parastagonospora nodorum]|uniref:Uncharacterized protein n=1 Tax=Phaeosphaeria nodorum (strain SN15 / ATCC MYA-4574 / FGSC 10173) TaxID=321614 RepID=A0A7U2ES29_PHANO|nr:hypothetical protein HBH56_001040 [Parastagonospora nodorum]QRC90094.1 hypothetical protein JI435_400120 [Parastagonospora nodorum SN15]KAH3937671.1 hypothetical protein HBH54_001050 [Parastagonospora nodorum]KAH3940855.1 hypothetical protein HBH53_210350 [Parastagonospora nodorum]KAH3958531.1 hypothetical protein HBH51_208880 [Parastagonospora nodorum]
MADSRWISKRCMLEGNRHWERYVNTSFVNAKLFGLVHVWQPSARENVAWAL